MASPMLAKKTSAAAIHINVLLIVFSHLPGAAKST
jgi:hypothetical protein